MSSAETEVVVKPVVNTNKERLEPHVQHDSHDEEYESADDAYEEIEIEEVEEEEEEEYDENQRSGSQQDKEKELDDDEDRKNPQFIPKRGYFYEHDDRTKVEEEGTEEEEPNKEEKKKPIETKEPNRWSHDLYNEDEQTPKSKDELSRAYGYEIWNEEQAPRARRRRRYGRGPNKYTRQWEDEEAYQKPRGGGGGGFRGRGGRGRGNFRDSKEPHEEDGFEEEFPALTTLSKPPQQQQRPVKSEKASEKQGSRNSLGRRDSVEDQPIKPKQQQHSQDHNRRGGQDYDRRYDHENERNASRGGGRGYGGDRGYGGGRGRGRRNEFSNRNRYANRRDEEDSNPSGGSRSEPRERPDNRPPRAEQRPEANREVRGPPPATNGQTRDIRPKDSPLPSKPPFTNTEYVGSHSLTANRTQNRSQHNHHNVSKQSEETESTKIQNRGPPQGQGNGFPDKQPRDLREVINARRMQQHQQQQQSSPNDRRSQMPPRLQQQAQQQQQHQMEQVSAKPKRFSAQRQRQVEPPMVNSSSVGGIPNSVPMTHGVPPNMIPVVTGTEQLVPSPVPIYPQAPTYYDNGPVYEASGSPVTVVTVTTDGPTGTPSLWAPHAYANVPYPSPPTGQQVPQPTYADHPAYITTQQAGPIYSGPPQFIQDPNMMNYQAAAPPFAPAYHPQTFQGYPQVTPAPPPEVYHGGVTYYSPQTQLQRQPMMAPKRTKTVLQLVEPPEKAKGDRHVKEVVQPNEQRTTPIPELTVHGGREQQIQQIESKPVPPPPVAPVEVSYVESELVQHLENVNLQQPPEEPIRKASPLPPQESWSAQMEEINSPTESPETSFHKVLNTELPELVKSAENSSPTPSTVDNVANVIVPSVPSTVVQSVEEECIKPPAEDDVSQSESNPNPSPTKVETETSEN